MTSVNENISRDLHEFEKSGLGKGPFSFVKVIETPFQFYKQYYPEKWEKLVTNIPDFLNKSQVGNCNYCGRPLRWNYILKSSDGKFFIVGCECVKCTGDKGLIKLIEEEKKRIVKETKNDRFRYIRRMPFFDEICKYNLLLLIEIYSSKQYGYRDVADLTKELEMGRMVSELTKPQIKTVVTLLRNKFDGNWWENKQKAKDKLASLQETCPLKFAEFQKRFSDKSIYQFPDLDPSVVKAALRRKMGFLEKRTHEDIAYKLNGKHNLIKKLNQEIINALVPKIEKSPFCKSVYLEYFGNNPQTIKVFYSRRVWGKFEIALRNIFVEHYGSEERFNYILKRNSRAYEMFKLWSRRI